jgi:S-layer protein
MAYTVDQLSTFFKNANAGTAPTAAQTLTLQALANQNAAGTLTNDQAFASTVDLASDTTTAVSVGTYQFFLGFAPSQAGLASLNTAYVGTGAQAGLNGENRFIAQAVSLALQNTTAKASFTTSYGSLSVVDATKAAYDIIIGNAAATAAGITVANSIAFLTSASSIAYYTAFVKANVPGLTTAADIDLAVKAAIIGEILYAATSYNNGAGLGSYASATTTLIKDLADDGVLAANNAAGIDLFASYGGTGTVGLTVALTTGVDTPVASGNNDTITASNTTFTSLDTIDGLAGNDTLVISDVAGGFSTATASGVTVKNVETVQVKSIGAATVDTTSWTGVTSLQTTTVGGVAVTASSTTGVVVTETALAAAANVTVDGGSTVSVTSSMTATPTGGNGKITIGGTTAPTGAVTVSASYGGADLTAQGAINVTGGSTVSITETAKNAVNTTVTLGASTVTGTTSTTAVTVAQTAAVGATASVAGVVNGAVTINDVNAASTTKAGTITTATITNAGTVTIADNSLATLNLSGAVGAVGITANATAISTGVAASTLGLNLGKGTTGTVTANQYKTLNVAVSGANTVANIAASAATALNVSGSDVLTLTSAAGLAALTTLNVTGTAGLTASNLNVLTALTKVDTTGTTGTSTLNIDATKVAFTGGAGSDLITLTGALASGGKIDLGAGNDRLSGTTAVATSTTTVIDGGAGTDTVASTLITAGNGALFKNFEVLGLANTSGTLDAALLTGSTLTGLELLASGGTYQNVLASQSLTVTANAGAGTTTLTFANVGGSADAYTINFSGVGGATSGAAVTYDAGTLAIANIENVTINSGSASGFSSNNIDLTDAAARSLTITGSQALDVSFVTAFGTTGANGLASINASAATGAITLNTTNVGIADDGLTVSTGSGNDSLTLTTAATVSTGAGNDTIVAGGVSTIDSGAGNDIVTLAGATGSTVNLGAGNDTVTTSAGGSSITLGGGNDSVNVVLTVSASATAPTLTTIVDTINAGDSIVFKGGATSEVFTAAAVTAVSGATSLVNALDIAISAAGNVNAQITWFQYGGDTYIVEHLANTTDFAVGDIVVKLTGLVDLSTASYVAGTDTLTLV